MLVQHAEFLDLRQQLNNHVRMVIIVHLVLNHPTNSLVHMEHIQMVCHH